MKEETINPGDVFSLGNEIYKFCGSGEQIDLKVNTCIYKGDDVVKIIYRDLFLKSIKAFGVIHARGKKMDVNVTHLDPCSAPPLEEKTYKYYKGAAFEVLAIGRLAWPFRTPTNDRWVVIKTMDSELIIAFPVEYWSRLFVPIEQSTDDQKIVH